MKRISLLLSTGILLCLISCTSAGKGEQKAEDTNAVTPFNIVMIKHPVKDFAVWKAGYMSHDSMRQAYGVTSLGIGRGMDDPNMVVVIDMIKDVQKAKEFAASPSLKEAMEKAGVSGPPEINYLSAIRNDTSEISTKDRVMVSHHVKDFDAWVKVYDGEGKATRAANGIVDRGMGRGVDDPNMVYILFAITDMAKAKARMGSEDLKKVMTDAGVDSAPTFFMYTLE